MKKGCTLKASARIVKHALRDLPRSALRSPTTIIPTYFISSCEVDTGRINQTRSRQTVTWLDLPRLLLQPNRPFNRSFQQGSGKHRTCSRWRELEYNYVNIWRVSVKSAGCRNTTIRVNRQPVSHTPRSARILYHAPVHGGRFHMILMNRARRPADDFDTQSGTTVVVVVIPRVVRE